jgi:hypothetical protein
MQGMAKAPLVARHHPLSIGVLATVIGVALGVSVVYLDQKEAVPVHAQGSGACQQQEEACMKTNNQGHTAACHSQWVQCITNKCVGSGGAAGQCNQDPECQSSCTESATSQGGKISCCDGGPKHGNTCRDKVDGQCNPKQTELGKEKGKGEESKGGEMPKLPEMPKGGGGEPKPKTDPCAAGASSSECKSTQTPSGVSGFLNNLFGNTSETETGTNSISSTLQSAASKLQAFLSGESTPAPTETSEVNNPTEATVTPVTPSAAQAGQIASQTGGAQQGSATAQGGTQGVGSTVTGFGSGASTETNETSGIMTAISQTLAGIRVTLRNLFGGLF